jgi:hypothetical protein
VASREGLHLVLEHPPLSGKAWSRTRGSPSPRSLYDIATPEVL